MEGREKDIVTGKSSDTSFAISQSLVVVSLHRRLCSKWKQCHQTASIKRAIETVLCLNSQMPLTLELFSKYILMSFDAGHNISLGSRPIPSSTYKIKLCEFGPWNADARSRPQLAISNISWYFVGEPEIYEQQERQISCDVTAGPIFINTIRSAIAITTKTYPVTCSISEKECE